MLDRRIARLMRQHPQLETSRSTDHVEQFRRDVDRVVSSMNHFGIDIER